MKTTIIKRTGRNNIQVNTKNYRLTSFNQKIVSSKLDNGEKKNLIQFSDYMTASEKKELLTLI